LEESHPNKAENEDSKLDNGTKSPSNERNPLKKLNDGREQSNMPNETEYPANDS